MRLDPELLRPEDRLRTFTQLGPGAAAAVTAVMEDGEAEEREKGMTILRELPPSAFSLPDGVGAGGVGSGDAGSGAVSSSSLDAALRAREILDLSATDPVERDRLATALRDPSPAIRYLASEQLEGAGTPDALETLLARADAEDPAVRTAVSAARFQVARLQNAVTPATAFELSDPGLELGSVHATRSLTTTAESKLDIFVQGLASDDPAVVKESLAGLVEMGAAARPAIPAVERLLATTSDRTLQDMARRALARLRRT
jgi:HEAT repeat protein